jgi:hypothetical protein
MEYRGEGREIGMESDCRKTERKLKTCAAYEKYIGSMS